MCGIVGYVGKRPCRDLLVAGLEKLEYRGYDSAGISLLEDGRIDSVRAVGNLANLRAELGLAAEQPVASSSVAVAAPPATIGLAHTRWATHGRVTEENAHPHGDCHDRIHIVLNGIVENHAELRRSLEADGHDFSSQTDAEIVAHLIERHYEAESDRTKPNPAAVEAADYEAESDRTKPNPAAVEAAASDGDLTEAVRAAFAELRGHYAFVAMHAEHPETLVAARHECPLIVGLGESETFVASAIPAFLRETRNVLGLKNGEIVTVTPDGAVIVDGSGDPVEREVEEVTWDEDAAEKGGYPTFMLKEIHEQPGAVAETITDRLSGGDRVDLSELELPGGLAQRLGRIVIVACGTSYHAGLVGRYAIEQWARIPVEMDIASEYRYRDPVMTENDLVIGITQSGETADTLAAIRLARERGAHVLAVTNVMGSQATRDADSVLYTRAGIEIGVAATKTFVSQVAAMYLLGLWLAQARGTLEPDRIATLIAELKTLPSLIQDTLVTTDDRVRAIARSHHRRRFFLYLGRNIGLPVCLEGALKLKEISYIPTDAYAAGEMKHGPIALLDENTPVVTIATDSPVLEKVLSNVAEVRARGADVISVATAGSELVAEASDQTIVVPRTDWILQPILAVLPLQLLAYYIARLNGLNVDQPRNLAKTVTVE
jgi:glucosamine--fructose-6-phosphate aminotransferase (isomerizing)